MRSKTHAVLMLLLVGSVGCGGTPTAVVDPGASAPTPTPIATPTPTPAATQPAPCRLTAPTVDCSERDAPSPEFTEALQNAIDSGIGTPGVMDAEEPVRLWDVNLFRSKVVDHLTAQKICGAWDYGNEYGDEIYVRSADGCRVEQYDLIAGAGGVRNPSNKTMLWASEWGEPVPSLKPVYPKEDPTCSLPSDRSTFCVQIRGTPGHLGAEVFQLLVQLLNEQPTLVDKADFLPGQGELIPDAMRMAAWAIHDPDSYTAAVLKKVRSRGYCAVVDKGDILKVKSVAQKNVFHEEVDIVQNPESGGSYTSFVVRDRCNPAGF